MPPFNLIDHPWIPVRWLPSANGEKPRLVSLHDAFSRSTEIADLAAAPHERIALTRLLVCIAHAALGAPDDASEWENFGQNLESATTTYLARPDIHPHFNLLGDGPRFLQAKLQDGASLVPNSKLIPELASGNNPTLLDHHGMNPNRDFSHAEVALALLVFQNYYPSYKTGQPPGPCCADGPCSSKSPLHLLLIGRCLKATILGNMLDGEALGLNYLSIGRPIWESEIRDEHHLVSYLGHLVPQHRKLWIDKVETGFFHVTARGGVTYPVYRNGFRMPSVTILSDRKGARYTLKARTERGIWRDLEAVTCSRPEGENSLPISAPLVIQSHSDQVAEDSLNLWLGALVTDESKFESAIESFFTVPAEMLSVAGHNVYSSGVGYSEVVAKEMCRAIKAYWMKVTNPDKKGKVPGWEIAEKHYWHHLDQNHRLLIALAAAPQPGQPAIGAVGAEDPWTHTVRDAAIAAYKSVCPRTTPRQIEAFALGYRPLHNALFPKPQKKSPARKTSTA
jgi:CRISPR system Cascade subunit CasA